MAGELKLGEVAQPSTPAASKQSLYASNDTPSRLKRVDSAGNVYIQQEFVFIGLTADYTLTNTGAAAEKVFNSPANGQITVPGSTTWEFEFQYILTNTGTTSHTWGVLFAGTATLTSAMMVVEGYTQTSNALTAPSMIYTTTITSVVVITAASTSATENVVIKGRGIVRFNAGGTFIPQIKPSAATGGTAKVLANSFFRMTPIGSNVAASMGNWS